MSLLNVLFIRTALQKYGVHTKYKKENNYGIFVDKM